MRSIGIVFILLIAACAKGSAQSDLSASGDLRSLAMSIGFEHPANVMKLLQWNDSLRMNRLKWIMRYDSLLSDTLAVSPSERVFVQLDASVLSYAAQPSVLTYSILKTAYQSLQPRWTQSENYFRELNAVMLEAAIAQNDFAMAYAIQNKIHAAQFADWKSEEKAIRDMADSLQRNADDDKRTGVAHISALNGQLMQWHLIAVAAIALLLIVIIIFFLGRNKWNKQRSILKAKVDDNTEKEVLVQKLEEARRELVEMKTLAKKKAEIPEVAPHVAPENKGILASDIAEWNEELQQALAKIKTHCEAGKSAMDVPTYMSIVNDVTRLSNKVGKKSEQWIATVTSK